MTHPLNPAMAATEPPPVMEARRWLAGVAFHASSAGGPEQPRQVLVLLARAS